MKKGLFGAVAIAMIFCGQAFGQACGCLGGGIDHGGYASNAQSNCPHAYTYEEANALWANYCNERPRDNCCGLCGLFGGGCGCLGGAAGCQSSRWPSACGCETQVNYVSSRLGCRGGLRARGGCGRGIGSVGGCNGGGFGWGNCGCDTGSSCDSCGPTLGGRHGMNLLGRSRGGCGCDGGALPGIGHCDSGCGCN